MVNVQQGQPVTWRSLKEAEAQLIAILARAVRKKQPIDPERFKVDGSVSDWQCSEVERAIFRATNHPFRVTYWPGRDGLSTIHEIVATPVQKEVVP